MKWGLLLSIALIMSVAVSAQDVEGFVNRQMQAYPKSRLLDIYKSCFQDYMGAEHLVSARQRVKAYLDEELNTTSLDNLMPWYYEPCGIDSSYYRVSIRGLKEIYRNYVVGESKTTALKLAQKKVKETPGFEDPKYWAAFVLLDGIDD